MAVSTETRNNEGKQVAAEGAPAYADGSKKTSGKPRIDWEDPTVPIGDAPSIPRWPVVVNAIAWFAWIGFLVAMVASRS